MWIILALFLFALPAQANWYNGDWLYRKKIVIEASDVPSNLTNFPVYLDLSDMPSDFFANVKSDCGDIRITDMPSSTEFAREIVECDTSGETGEVHFKVPLLSSTHDNIFYVYYGNSSASDYAVSGTYGRNNVWSSYNAVYHMNENPAGSAPQIIDSTGNNNNATSQGSMTSNDLTSGLVGKAIDFDGTNDRVEASDSASLSISTGSFSAWLRPTTLTNVSFPSPLVKLPVNESYLFVTYSSTVVRIKRTGFGTLTDATQASAIPNNQWTRLAGTYDGSTLRHYRNDSLITSTSASGTITDTAGNLTIGGISTTNPFRGKVDEVRISSTVFSANWISTEYANQNSPSTFYTIIDDNGWYSNDWLYRQKITVDNTKVAANLTDFPVYLDTDELSTGFYANAKSDCGDVRITLADGTTEVPREIVFCDGTNGEIHFKAVGTLSGSADTDFYVYYGNSSASDYAVSATYGRNNVWSDYAAVWHMNEDPSGSAPQIINSTGGTSATTYGSMASGQLISGKVGKTLNFDGVNDYLEFGSSTMLYNNQPFTISMYMYLDSFANSYPGFFRLVTNASNAFLCLITSNSIDSRYEGLNWGSNANWAKFRTTTPGANFQNTWKHSVLTYQGSSPTNISSFKAYTDGVSDTLRTTHTFATSLNTTNQIATYNKDITTSVDGKIDEFRIALVERSADWISTEYANQNSPSTFYTASAEESQATDTPANAIFFGTIF